MSALENTAVWIYGSHARGDADELSDFDLLAISDQEVSVEVVNRLLEAPRVPSLTHYSWDEIGAMASYGSLFLRHLQLEGRAAFESPDAKGKLARILSLVGDYKFASRDVSGFRSVVQDVRASLRDGGSPAFEMSVLGTVVRHASILGCAVSGSYCFSRCEPVAKVVAEWGLPGEVSGEFPALYQYRICVERREIPMPIATKRDAVRWSNRADSLVDALETRVDGLH